MTAPHLEPFGKAIGMAIRDAIAPLKARIAELERRQADLERAPSKRQGITSQAVPLIRKGQE